VSKRDLFIGFGAGLASGLLSAATLINGNLMRRAEAQVAAAPPAARGRFEISAWSAPGISGAYVLDTQSGEVWLVRDHERVRSLGKVESK
jgi:hypothetical protein